VVSGSFPDRIRNPDQDPGGQKMTQKIEKNLEISCFEELDVLFLGMKASSAVWTSFMEAYVVIIDQKNIKFLFQL
jgi:hypothetical protein